MGRCSRRKNKKVILDIPITLGEAINDYINGPLLLHRSAENEKYPLRVTAESWLGDIPLKDLQIKHFAFNSYIFNEDCLQ